jgi:hypothetical protein
MKKLTQVACILVIVFLVNSYTAFSQISISGPTCGSAAGPNSIYTINGNYTSNTYIEWCVTGGTIINASSCHSGQVSQIGTSITVQWDAQASSGQISLTTFTGEGDATPLNVTLQAISHAEEDIISQDQLLNYVTLPATLTSQTNTGDVGGCGGNTLAYLWEFSTSLSGPFTPTGVISPSYPFWTALQQTTFFRRRVTSYFGEVYYSNIIKIEIVSVYWENLNYVRVHDIKKPGLNDWQSVDALPIGDKLQSTTYLDGQGRKIQQVERGISPAANNTWKDIVKPFEYDEAGRLVNDYLPYAASDNPGKYKTGAVATQKTYIQSFFGEPSTANTY